VTTTPYSFSLTSFNILGSQHTAPGGGAPGFAPGRLRAEWAARIVLDRDVDVVGWSELQPDQYAAMTRALGGRYTFWPGSALKYAGTPASLMWRHDRFSAVWKGTVTIPFLGQKRPMPVVQLRHLGTGREFYVMNVHNAPGGHEGERDRAEALELATIKSFREESGLPFFLTGDFNEHGEIFCNVRNATDLLAANGGSMSGGCQPPGGRPRLDWVFGSPDATFTGYLADKGATIQRITDHAVIFTTVDVH
jgi:endonuclease/exonuclease/phosphatase family metal-dependent hydrolase